VQLGATRLAITLVAVCLTASLSWPADTAKVIRVVDGDTLLVEINGRTERVRLIGADTPETVHPQNLVEYLGSPRSRSTRPDC
jgi:micrococcal nuclease